MNGIRIREEVPLIPQPQDSTSGADPRIRLHELRNELVAELESASQALTAMRALRADRSDDDEHDPEGAPLSAEWSRLDRVHRAAQKRVQDVDDALRAVEAGRYGRCSRCQETIAPGRLEFMPAADRCVRCAGRR